MVTTLPTPSILVAVDAIVIALTKGALQVLLVQRNDTAKKSRVLPGGFISKDETLHAAAKRKLQEETGYNKFTIHEIGIFDAVKRDNRARVISAGFLALTNKTDFPFKDGYHTINATFFPINAIPTLLYDHKEIIQKAISYLQDKIMHTDIAKQLFGKEFTLTELQKIYESILGKPLNVRNFRKKITDIGLVVPTGGLEIGVGHRPAQYYKFA